jgi:hypothetical protein
LIRGLDKRQEVDPRSHRLPSATDHHLPDLSGDGRGEFGILRGVNLRHVTPLMSEEHLRGFEIELLANSRREAMAKLVGEPAALATPSLHPVPFGVGEPHHHSVRASILPSSFRRGANSAGSGNARSHARSIAVKHDCRPYRGRGERFRLAPTRFAPFRFTCEG